jgi:hypothetical protein
VHFFAGSAAVRVAVTLRNPAPAGHPGGRWTLGASGSIYLRDVAFRFAVDRADTRQVVDCSLERGTPPERYAAPFELYQESSGGERWDSPNHRNRHGVVPHRLRGYQLRTTGVAREGLRASPIVTMSNGADTITVAVAQFWQNFPKSIECDGGVVTLRLFPRRYPDLHELQGGEQKTHTFVVAFDRDSVTSVPLAWCRSPLVARAAPSWYCGSRAVPYLVPLADDRDRDYVALIQSAIVGDASFERKREAVDEYGWRHFGDVYADHEAVFERERVPLTSHYNNQYDGIAGFACQFLRSADTRWWTLMQDLASHVADIDTYHTSGDKAAYNRGLFWHTYHYVDAGTSSHRSYPSHPKVNGGGPSGEHNYSTGLLLHHFLTGDPQSREIAIQLAQWVIDMDDGRQTIFRWVDRGDTGAASASGSMDYHGPGRGPGNSIVALINGHRLTGDARFLDKAEALIRRCIHPDDDVDAHKLLDAERRWFYTVFLQAIGRYLDYKTELGARDRMFAYARASLLRYATWMTEHEYPYLDRPEILEFPTETWAAQDIRKSDVLRFAAKYGDDDARPRFIERADFFFQSSVSSLGAAPTRTLARPVTLLLTNGLMRAGCAAFERVGDAHAQTPSPAFGRPERFVPQKTRALQRVQWLAASSGVLALAALLYLFL